MRKFYGMDELRTLGNARELTERVQEAILVDNPIQAYKLELG
jgi:hypothetical protein